MQVLLTRHTIAHGVNECAISQSGSGWAVDAVPVTQMLCGGAGDLAFIPGARLEKRHPYPIRRRHERVLPFDFTGPGTYCFTGRASVGL